MDEFSELFTWVDKNTAQYIERLKDIVALAGVSADPLKREFIVQTAEWVKKWAEKLGATCELRHLGNQTRHDGTNIKLPDGTDLKLPPVLLVEFGKDPNKKTVMVYGHLDVQPAERSDGWNTDPFMLTEKDGKLFGRGSTDDKGPVLCWLWAIESFLEKNKDKGLAALPINIKMVLEGMEESGSKGLPKLVRSLAVPSGFLDPSTIDCGCISDSYWLGKKKPCISYGLRGICYFHLEVKCSTRDLHSGVIGGSVHEAMTDLVHLMAGLVDSSGKILVPNIMDKVAAVSEEEKKNI